MKIIAIVAGAAVLTAAVPVIAQQTNEEKVICELAAKNCLNKADILEKRVKKLNAEIRKGSKAYSAEELKKLDQKLKETQDLLDTLEGKAPAK
jgi:flagellar motility protein MotE (MotC chaperone)